MQTTQKTFRKVLKHRGNDFEIFSRSKSDLSQKDGTIEEIEGADGKTLGYCQKFNTISGYIDDVIVQKRYLKRGDSTVKEYEIDIHFESGDEKVIIRLGFDQGGGRDFATTFRNINVKKQVTFFPYQLKAKDGQKYGRAGLSICEGPVWDKDSKIPRYYDKEYQEKKGLDFTKVSRGEEKFDKEAFADWLYDNFIEDVYYVFKHYEEKPQEEPRDRDDNRGRGRDDDRRSSRDNDREERGRNDDRGRDSRDDDRGRGRDDDRDRERGRDDSRDRRDDDRGRGSEREERGRGRDEREPAKEERSYRERDNNGRDDDRRSSRNDDKGREEPPFHDDDDLPF